MHSETVKLENNSG